MIKDHKWNKEDAIITFFYVINGTKGLLVANENELAEIVIGSSLDSLKIQALNFKYLMTESDHLKYSSDNQKEVFANYSKKSYDELKDIVNTIILKRDFAKNKEDFKKEKALIDYKKMAKNAAKKRKKDLADIFIMMGKDPKKMRKL